MTQKLTSRSVGRELGRWLALALPPFVLSVSLVFANHRVIGIGCGILVAYSVWMVGMGSRLPGEVEIGSDGLLLSGPFLDRFVAFRDIESVRSDGFHVSVAAGGSTYFILDPKPIGPAATQRILEERANAVQNAPGQSLMLDGEAYRASDDVSAWERLVCDPAASSTDRALAAERLHLRGVELWALPGAADWLQPEVRRVVHRSALRASS